MRKFQITINLQMFDEDDPKKLSVYVDSNSLWGTICAGFSELVDALHVKGYISSVVKEHCWKQEK